MKNVSNCAPLCFCLCSQHLKCELWTSICTYFQLKKIRCSSKIVDYIAAENVLHLCVTWPDNLEIYAECSTTSAGTCHILHVFAYWLRQEDNFVCEFHIWKVYTNNRIYLYKQKIPQYHEKVYMHAMLSPAESIPNKLVTPTRIFHSWHSRSGLSKGGKSLFSHNVSLLMLLQRATNQTQTITWLLDQWDTDYLINKSYKKDFINITMIWKLSC